MDASDGIPGCTILEYVAKGGLEITFVVVITVQDQVEWNSPRTTAPSGPVLEGVTPETHA